MSNSCFTKLTGHLDTQIYTENTGNVSLFQWLDWLIYKKKNPPLPALYTDSCHLLIWIFCLHVVGYVCDPLLFDNDITLLAVLPYGDILLDIISATLRLVHNSASNSDIYYERNNYFQIYFINRADTCSSLCLLQSSKNQYSCRTQKF